MPSLCALRIQIRIMITDEFGRSHHAAAKYDIETQYHATPKKRRKPLPHPPTIDFETQSQHKKTYILPLIISCDRVIVKSFFGLFLSKVVGILRMP